MAMPEQDKRSELAFTLLKPVEHEALKKRAAERGSTVSSTIRLLVLKDLFGQANRAVQLPVEADSDWPEAAGR